MKIKIMLVEDHQIVLEGLKTLLDTEKNFEIIGEANNGVDALKFCTNNHPDIVILDIGLPGMSGMDVLIHLTKNNPEVKVIILSMHADRFYVTSMIRSGAKGYLVKESAYEDLVKAINVVNDGGVYLSQKIKSMIIEDFVQGEGPSGNSGKVKLTHRETDVLKLLANGKSNHEIAEILLISIKTVETYRSRLIKKLKLRNIAELTRYAIKNNLVEL
ncbi:response regulator transcription factor [bacterium]|nr:response regulator transcription factor [bacterium]